MCVRNKQTSKEPWDEWSPIADTKEVYGVLTSASSVASAHASKTRQKETTEIYLHLEEPTQSQLLSLPTLPLWW